MSLRAGADTEARGKNPLPRFEPLSSSLWSATLLSEVPKLRLYKCIYLQCKCLKVQRTCDNLPNKMRILVKNI
jgi:hypothetical protein